MSYTITISKDGLGGKDTIKINLNEKDTCEVIKKLIDITTKNVNELRQMQEVIDLLKSGPCKCVVDDTKIISYREKFAGIIFMTAELNLPFHFMDNVAESAYVCFKIGADIDPVIRHICNRTYTLVEMTDREINDIKNALIEAAVQTGLVTGIIKD